MKDTIKGFLLLATYPTYRWIKANFKFLAKNALLLLIAGVLLKGCLDSRAERDKQAAIDQKELAAWIASPEYAFRFCITTVAGANGTATPEQIMACNKAAGR